MVRKDNANERKDTAALKGQYTSTPTKYAIRLKEQDLPASPTLPPVQTCKPVQVAELAALLDRFSTEETVPRPHTLAERAKALLDAANLQPLINQQASIVVRGLFHYHEQDWRTAASGLIRAFRTETFNAFAKEEVAQIKERLKRGRRITLMAASGSLVPEPDDAAVQKASQLVKSLWHSCQFRNADLLNALYHGRADYPKRQFDEFQKFLNSLKPYLRWPPEFTATVSGSAETQADGPTQYLISSINDAWSPLCADAEPYFRAAELLRAHQPNPDYLRNANGYAEYPEIARWLILRRQLQQS